MPTSREGFEYETYLFKPVEPSIGGGCHAHVFMPPKDKVVGGKVPVAISFHGGGFTIGDGLFIFAGHVEYLLNQGFAVVGLEYRMAPHVRLDEVRQDLVDGYRWVLTELPKLHPEVDATRNFVFGGSAGATSTMMLSADAHAAGLPLPRANYIAYPMVELNHEFKNATYTPYDQAMKNLSPEEKKKVDILLAEPVSTAHDILAEDPEDPSPRKTWAMVVIGKSASLKEFLTGEQPPYSDKHNPIACITKTFPPSVWVQATGDQLLDPAETKMAHDKLTSLGIESKLLVAEGMLHGALEFAPPFTKEEKDRWWDNISVPAMDFCIAKCRA